MENKDKQLNEKLVKQLEAYMDKRNLKKYQLANHLGTTEANVSRWLSRKHIIGNAWQQLIKIKLNLED
jgi:hypothetical protein